MNKLPCTQKEYDTFKEIKTDFDYLLDNPKERQKSKYKYKVVKIIKNMETFWPTFERICDNCNISRKTSLYIGDPSPAAIRWTRMSDIQKPLPAKQYESKPY